MILWISCPIVIVSLPFVFTPARRIHLFEALKFSVSVKVLALKSAAVAKVSDVAPAVPVVVPVPTEVEAAPILIVV